MCTFYIYTFIYTCSCNRKGLGEVLGTGQDESGSRDEALLWPLVEREQFGLAAFEAAVDVLVDAHVHPFGKSFVHYMSS